MKRKYKINFKKVKRNILIIAFIALSIFYIKCMNNYTNKNLKSCQEFAQYAEENNIALTQDNYNKYLNK